MRLFFWWNQTLFAIDFINLAKSNIIFRKTLSIYLEKVSVFYEKPYNRAAWCHRTLIARTDSMMF